MEVSYYHAIPSPQLEEGWFDNFNQQDFCEGAKGLNSLHPVSPSSTSNDVSTYDEWMRVHETLGCSEFEPFKEVLLPETKDFGPDFFGILDEDKLLPESTFNELNISDDLYGADNIYINSQAEYVAPGEKPKITTIKLKKVKVPKKNRSSKNNLQVCNYEVASSSSEAEGSALFKKEIEFQAANYFVDNTPLEPNYLNEFSSSFKSEVDKLFSDDYIDLKNFLRETEEPDTNIVPSNLTLKEAITMENADVILDACLSPDRSSFSLGSPQEQLLNLSFQENLFSPENSSQCSYSEGALSPSSSLGDSQFDANLTTDTQMLLDDDDSFTPSCSKNEEPARRGRKPRQKMTPESRYLRKKEQNKQAALRYRAKKKLEDEHLLETLKEEGERNTKLKKEWRNLSQEYKFMKNLMKESLIARNLVPPNVIR